MRAQLRPAVVSFLVLTVLTGLLYPLAVTAVAQVAFPWQANGSLIVAGGKTLGSSLIGQPFAAPKYFWGRPSATSPFPYNAAASSGSNLGPSNPALIQNVQARLDALHAADPGRCRSTW
jgi:K+-transporting ATPase KdpC subunit